MTNDTCICGAFEELCTIELENCANSRYRTLTRRKYDQKQLRVLKCKLYSKLFTHLCSPYVVSEQNFVTHISEDVYEVFDQFALEALYLKAAGEKKKGERLENLVESLKETVDLQVEAPLKFILSLARCGTDSRSVSQKGYGKSQQIVGTGRWINQERGAFGSSLDEQNHLEYNMELTRTFHLYSTQAKIFSVTPGAHFKNVHSVFLLEPSYESQHIKETRTTLFGALTHSRTNDMDIVLSLPELPDDTSRLPLARPESKLTEISEDEGFIEPSEISSISSSYPEPEQLEDHSFAHLRIWTDALKLPAKRNYTWEQLGNNYDERLDRPYLTDMGPKAFDHLYNVRLLEVEHVLGASIVYRMTCQKELVQHSINVLIGLPSTTYTFQKPNCSFKADGNLRISGLSAESLNGLLQNFAEIASYYSQLNRFTQHHSEKVTGVSGGLILRAFVDGLSEYLYTYKAAVISIEDTKNLTLLRLWTMFGGFKRQLKFLADICLCSAAFGRPKNAPKPKFPMRLKLLTYLQNLCSQNSSTEHYYVLLHLFKFTSVPFIRFISDWLFEGVCHDPFGEFFISVNDHYLVFRDKRYWTDGFSMKPQYGRIPLLAEETADQVFKCGKVINLLKLTCPKHYLFESKIVPPSIDIRLSLDKLEDVAVQSQEYAAKIQSFARIKKEEAIQQKLLEMQQRHMEIAAQREKAAEALRKIEGIYCNCKAWQILLDTKSQNTMSVGVTEIFKTFDRSSLGQRLKRYTV